MAKHKIAYIARRQADTTTVEEGLAGLDYELEFHVPDSQGETIEAVKGADLVIDMRVPMPRAVIEQMDAAKGIVTHGIGFDEIDHRAAAEKGIMLANCAGFCSEEMSNHATMMILACAKKLVLADDLVRTGRWAENRVGLGELPPINGQVLGLVGVGNIGRPTARKAQVFGLQVIAYDPYLPPWDANEQRVELVGSLNELASRSDYVSVHTPLNTETRHFIDAQFLKAMKPSAYLINISRGPIVDENALVNALREGEIAGAGLDVFEEEPLPSDSPLLQMDNVTFTPHSGGRSTAANLEGMKRVGEEAARILRGHWPMSLVNPEVRSRVPSRPAAMNL